MNHNHDLTYLESAVGTVQRRARLFVLCHQQHRAAQSAAASDARAERELTTEELEKIRERAVKSFARPA